jgi:hypothetical protein
MYFFVLLDLLVYVFSFVLLIFIIDYFHCIAFTAWCTWTLIMHLIFASSNFQILCNGTFITYLLTPCGRFLLEKLTGFAASPEIPRFYGTRKFNTVLTSVRHMPYPEPAPSSSHNPLPLPPNSLNCFRFLLIMYTGFARLAKHRQ